MPAVARCDGGPSDARGTGVPGAPPWGRRPRWQTLPMDIDRTLLARRRAGRAAVPLVAALLSASLAGCGGGDDPGPSAVLGTSVEAPAPSPPPPAGGPAAGAAGAPPAAASPVAASPVAASPVAASPVAPPPVAAAASGPPASGPPTSGPSPGGPSPGSPPAGAAPPATASGFPGAVALTASAPVALLTREQVDAVAAQRGWAAVAGPARCDVALHRIQHPTVGIAGEPSAASGAVLVPRGAGCAGPFPLLSYSRGTDRDRARTLAAPDDRETQALAAFFATRGFAVVASDYLGYAQSPYPFHPYLAAESAARTNADAIRAARVLLAGLGTPDDGRLYVAGYSQGGHAALATQRALERDRPADLPPPVAVGPMSGPYDLAGSFADYAGLVPALALQFGDLGAPGSVAIRLGGSLRVDAAELLRDRDALRGVLQSNSVLGWRPLAPVLLCGGARDPVVPFANTTRAAADFAARGASVAVVDVDQVPQWQPLLPQGTRLDALGSYHQGAVPPLCFAAVRDLLFAPAR